jgi:osmotically-inducible protein OsmY
MTTIATIATIATPTTAIAKVAERRHVRRRAAHRCAAASCVVDNQPEREDEEAQTTRRRRRRDVLLTACATSVAFVVANASPAMATAPKGYDEPQTNASGWNDFESDDASTSRRAYAIEWPSGWCSLSDLASARTVGVDASFKDPNDEASTLAVFITKAPTAAGAPQSVREKYGNLDVNAKRRADSAPNQFNVGKRNSKVFMQTQTRASVSKNTEVEAQEIETKVGGGTAGRFGSAVELVKIFIDPDDGTEYLIRATASAGAWPNVKGQLRRAVASFRFVRQ